MCVCVYNLFFVCKCFASMPSKIRRGHWNWNYRWVLSKQPDPLQVLWGMFLTCWAFCAALIVSVVNWERKTHSEGGWASLWAGPWTVCKWGKPTKPGQARVYALSLVFVLNVKWLAASIPGLISSKGQAVTQKGKPPSFDWYFITATKMKLKHLPQ